MASERAAQQKPPATSRGAGQATLAGPAKLFGSIALAAMGAAGVVMSVANAPPPLRVESAQSESSIAVIESHGATPVPELVLRASPSSADAVLVVAASVASSGATAEPVQPIEAPKPAQPSSVAQAVDINRASAAELEMLPGIGPALAARIVEERSRTGPFARVEDLDRVRGIGARTIEKLRPYVVVGDR